jgi:3-phosphoshikimate 1-carboxyvinyltransferase
MRGDRVTVSGGTLLGRSIDVSQNPDLFPILAVLGACARGMTRLSGGEHLRFKESDRIATTVAFLRTMGADIEATPDGCVVRGPATLRGARIVTEGDHRIAMAAAVAALAAEGVTNIEDEGSHAVSYPTFLDDLRSLGAKVVV